MRLIDADALIDDLMDRYCKECNKRRGIKNGKYRIIYEIGDVPCRACEVDDIKVELEEAPSKYQWISVKERLPENDKPVLITAWTDTLMIAWYYSGLWETEDCYLDLDEVKAWMPLPEPYKERG